MGPGADDIQWGRYLAALRRHKWIMAAVVVLGTAAGVAFTRLLSPEYQVHATIWISTERAQSQERAGPIRGQELVQQTSWPELLTSFAILEKVARQTKLYVSPGASGDAAAFAEFATDDRFRPGQYELRISDSGQRYELASGDGVPLETGTVGDSIGRSLGFRWAPSPAALGRGRSMKFTLATPREAAIGLRQQLSVSLPQGSNLLSLSLMGSDPQRITNILNAVVEEFLSVTAELKKRNLIEVGKILKQQLDYAEKELRDAERALEEFRVRTIALPSEAPAPTPGVARTPDPVFENFFDQTVEYENTRRDREALERTLAAIRQGSLEVSALRSAPGTGNAEDLQAALTEYSTTETALRAAQRTYTDDHRTVRELQQEMQMLATQTIPRLTMAAIAQLRSRESDLQGRLQNSAATLRGIPARTAEATRLERNVEGRETLYRTLKARYEEATLAEASTIPDVSVLDAPVAPQLPSRNRAPFIILMAAVASTAAAIALALLLDRFDPRLRYPEQAADQLGLDVIGTIPAIRQLVPERRDPEEAAQVLEAFRSIRLHLSHAFDSGQVILSISSPSPGDGKSLVALNLAFSFAEAGYRTVLVDGDTRRGQLHVRLGVEPRPGLLDYLAGARELDGVLRSLSADRLMLIPRGTSHRDAPELLMSPALPALMDELKRDFDAIIVDTPPLGAGVDPFVLSTATGNVLMVLRSGETDRKMAEVKLKLLERLPVRPLGAVLNAMHDTAGYRYYAYSYADELAEEPTPQLELQVAEFARRTRRSPVGRS